MDKMDDISIFNALKCIFLADYRGIRETDHRTVGKELLQGQILTPITLGIIVFDKGNGYRSCKGTD